MPGELALTVGQTKFSVPIRLTAAQIRTVIRRYAVHESINLEGRTDQEIVEDVLRSILKRVADVSKESHRRELMQEQSALIEQRLKDENDMFEPVTPQSSRLAK